MTNAPITTANVFAARISDASRKFLTLPLIMSAIWRAWKRAVLNINLYVVHMMISGTKKQLMTTISSYFGGGNVHRIILSEDIMIEKIQMMMMVVIAFSDVIVV